MAVEAEPTLDERLATIGRMQRDNPTMGHLQLSLGAIDAAYVLAKAMGY